MTLSGVTSISIPEGNVTQMRIGETVLWAKAEDLSNVWYDFGEVTIDDTLEGTIMVQITERMQDGETYIMCINGQRIEGEFVETGSICEWQDANGEYHITLLYGYNTCTFNVSVPEPGTYTIRIEYAE